jgi:hypothetical protein
MVTYFLFFLGVNVLLNVIYRWNPGVGMMLYVGLIIAFIIRPLFRTVTFRRTNLNRQFTGFDPNAHQKTSRPTFDKNVIDAEYVERNADTFH